MCGISGILLRKSESAKSDLLERMAAEMRTRGPDAHGIYTHGNVGLAHTRLRVIDLSSAADQPMSSLDGRFTLVFNGEIYNYRELRIELENLGRKFRSTSDTEVALQALEEWGLVAFARFNGMFAIAAWDSRKKVLHLARDRFGIKPLFFAHIGSRWAFASELKPLFQLDWISRQVDRDSLFYFLKFSHVPSPATLIQGVEQLKPGTILSIRENGESQATQYFDLLTLAGKGPEARSVEPVSESQLLTQLDELLQRVVAGQMISDVPLGCFLSGGIDSSLLTLTAAKLSPKPLHTFTVGYAEALYDESPFARLIAEKAGTHHHEFILAPKDFYTLIPELPTYFDQPFADPTLLPTLLLCKRSRDYVTVALSGDGGDELFFGYSYQALLMKLRLLMQLPHSVRRVAAEALRMATLRLPGKSARTISKGLEILQFKNKAELFQYFIGTVGPMRLDRLASLMATPPDLKHSLYDTWLPQIAHLPWEAQIEQLFLRTFLPDTVLAKTDRAGMAYGLEARVPFLDKEMAAFAARLPFESKYRGGTGKLLLRKLLATQCDPHLAWRKKQGFSIPIGEWLRGDLKYLMEGYLSPERLRRGGDFNPDGIQNLIKAHLSGKVNQGHLIWSLISYELWKEKYIPA